MRERALAVRSPSRPVPLSSVELRLSSDGELLACCHGVPDPCVRLWRRRRRRKTLEEEDDGDDGSSPSWYLASTLRGCHERTIRSVAFAPSNAVLATASFDGTIGIWEDVGNNDEDEDDDDDDEDVWECTAQLEGHDNEAKCVAWNSDGTLLATCGRDKSVWIWECLLDMTTSARNGLVDGGGDGEFECLAVLHGHTGDVKKVVFAPSNGQWGDGEDVLLSASYDDTVKCWAEDGGDWYCAATLSQHVSTVWDVAVAPGGARLVTASDDRSLAVWRCRTSAEKAASAFEKKSNDGSCDADGAWECVGTMTDVHELAIHSVACAPARAGHGRLASTGADTVLQIHREVAVSADGPRFALDVSVGRAHGDADVNHVVWHPRDGTTLATVGDDGVVRLWRYLVG